MNNHRSRKHLDKLKAEYVETYLGHQGLKQHKSALESTRSVLSKGLNASSITFPGEGHERKSIGSTMTARNNITFANESEVEDIAVINKKIRVSDCRIKETKNELKEKSKEIEEAKADINEYKMRWDMLQAQINKLHEQYNKRIAKMYKEVGEKVKVKSKAYVNMFT